MSFLRNLARAAISRHGISSANAWKVTGNNVIIEAPETKLTTLNSGLRVASEFSKLSTATVGVWIDGGSRYETLRENGVAHFLEHMNFKGTRKRNQYDLELEVENLGAHLNAYTSREHTVYFAKCLSKDVEKAVEILSDILLNSIYGLREIEIERSVILREMEEVEQNMQEVVFDHLHAGAFKGCSLSFTILGPVQNIKSLNRQDFQNYIQGFYKGPKMILCGAGGVEHNHLVELANKYFGNIERGSDEILKYEPGVFQQSHQIIDHTDMTMIYGCLAVEGPSWTHSDCLAMQLANTLIGQYNCSQGQGLGGSSILADMIDFDGVDSFMSFTTNYKDTGLTGVYFSVSEEVDGAIYNMTKLITKAFHRLCFEVDETMLTRAKRSLFTNILLMLDGSTPICEDIGRQLLCYGRRISVPELSARINDVTSETIKQLAKSYFIGQKFAYTVVGGKKDWPTEKQIQDWLKP